MYDSDERPVNIMNHIRETIEKHEFSFDGISSSATVSAGIAKYDYDINLDSWVRRADRKLYECKNTGKNKVIM